MLATALDSVVLQEIPESISWEILVVDNNSTDETAEVVENFCQRFPNRIRYVFEKRQGLSYARNTGIRHARGEILAFTDDDVVVERNWLNTLTSPLSTGQWIGTGGKVVRSWNCPQPNWLAINGKYEKMAFPVVLFDLGTERREIDDFAIGANMAYRRQAFLKYGDFRTDLGRSGDNLLSLEDSEFARRLRAAGERLLYEPSAIVHHPVPQNRLSKDYFLRWWFAFGRSSYRSFSPGCSVWGIPRPYLRFGGIVFRLLLGALAWALATNRQARFYHKTQVWRLLGQIVEWFHQAAPSGFGRTGTLESEAEQ